MEYPKYTSISRNGRNYRVKFGYKAHLVWLTEQKEENPSFKLPTGIRMKNGNATRNTKFNSYIRQRAQEVRHEAKSQFFPDFVEEQEREAKTAKERKEVRNSFLAIKNKVREPEVISIPKFPNISKYRFNVQPKINASATDDDFVFKVACVIRTMLIEAKKRKLGSTPAQITYKVNFITDEGNYRSFAFKSQHFDDLEHQIEMWIEKFPSIRIEEITSGEINVIKILTTGGCETSNERSFCITDFPKLRIWLRSPKSTNDNCGIACVAKFLGLQMNKIPAKHIRSSCRLPSEGKIDYLQMKEVLKFFKVSGRMYVHPLKHENDFAWEYKHHGEETSALGDVAPKCVNIHLIGEKNGGHYSYEWKPRTSYFACIKCGKGTGTRKDGSTRLQVCEYEGQTECGACNLQQKSYFEAKVKGEKRVVCRKNKPHEPANLSKICFFDIETFQTNYQKNSSVYAVGWMMGDWKKPRIEIGKGAWEKFIEFVTNQSDTTFVAYNGAKFDHYFLVNSLMKIKYDIDYKSFIEADGRLLGFSFGQDNKIWDLCLFTQGSLDDVSKDFKCENQKGKFNHNLVKSFNDADRHKNEVTDYLALDVIVLKDCFVKFGDMIYEKEALDCTKFLTLSHMAYTIWSRSGILQETEIYFDYSQEQYEMIRASIYGGRCYPTNPVYKSPLADVQGVTHEEVKNSLEYLIAADVCSLYPASMRGCKLLEKPRYPVGRHRWSNNPEEDFKVDKLGVYHVKFTCPKDIVEPILPRREKGLLVWSLNDGEGFYNNVDLTNAVNYGYKLNFCGKAVVWDKYSADLFTEYVDKYVNMKIKATKEKNDVVRQIAKILLNALYGKMFQKPITDSRLFPKTQEEVNEWIMSHDLKDMQLFKEAEQWIIIGEKRNNEAHKYLSKPCQFGGFVTAYSRQIMLKISSVISPDLKTPFKYYGDTDSLFVTGKNWKKLEDAGLTGDELGMLNNDLKKYGDGLILEGYHRAPKTYGSKYITNSNEIKSDKMGLKGIPSKCDVTFDDVRDATLKTAEYTSFKKTASKSDGYYEQFTVSVQKCFRTLFKNKWNGWDLYKDGFYRPKGYKRIAQAQ